MLIIVQHVLELLLTNALTAIFTTFYPLTNVFLAITLVELAQDQLQTNAKLVMLLIYELKMGLSVNVQD